MRPIFEGFNTSGDGQIHSPAPATTIPFVIPGTVENFESHSSHTDGYNTVRNNREGWVNSSCGYDSDNILHNLPTNELVGECNKATPDYNKNLYTQTIQPGVYTTNQIIEPVNSNIGISFTQQFPPVTCKRDPLTDELHYTEHDPRIFIPKKKIPTLPTVTESNVYDPRFTGYGTSYRAYTEDVTGQTRFYYDDINSIRMPNYITRNNIDHTSFGDSYGPLYDGNACGNTDTSEIRALANDEFLRATLQFRTELQERLMRKRNSEMWQLRKAPIRTFGGMKC